MQAHATDSVLIEQVVFLASRARQATGQDPIFDLPKGKPNGQSCPIARALNMNCSVASTIITFQTDEQAQKVAEAVGGTAKGSRVNLPSGHPFARFVERFDASAKATSTGRDRHLRQLSMT